MTTHQKIILAVSVLLLVGIIAAGFVFQNKTEEEQTKLQQEKLAQEKAATQTAKEIAPPVYTSEVPKDAKPTKPAETIPLEATGGATKQGYFNITATSKGYDPETITVNSGDIVSMRFTATGGSYDLFIDGYSFHVSAPDGGTTEKSFQPTTTGTFLMQCRDACPASGKIYGKLIVL